MGGLGNQLFQVANGISLSIKYNMDVIFSYSDKKNYYDSIFKYIIQKKEQIKYPVDVYNEPEFTYNEIIIQDINNIIICVIKSIWSRGSDRNDSWTNSCKR